VIFSLHINISISFLPTKIYQIIIPLPLSSCSLPSLKNKIKVYLFLYPAAGDFIKEPKKRYPEHHPRSICRLPYIGSISIPAELVNEAEILLID
jgi:hypothetical protein